MSLRPKATNVKYQNITFQEMFMQMTPALIHSEELLVFFSKFSQGMKITLWGQQNQFHFS